MWGGGGGRKMRDGERGRKERERTTGKEAERREGKERERVSIVYFNPFQNYFVSIFLVCFVCVFFFFFFSNNVELRKTYAQTQSRHSGSRHGTNSLTFYPRRVMSDTGIDLRPELGIVWPLLDKE